MLDGNSVFQYTYSIEIENESEKKMTKLVIGFILGVVVSTIGFAGVARVLDRAVDTVKTTSYELSR